MSQCVPSWDLDGKSSSFSATAADDDAAPTLDYEVAELIWANGQLALHGLGPPRIVNNRPISTSKYSSWPDKPGAAGGTLESIVNQATRFLPSKDKATAGDELVSWINLHHTTTTTTSTSTSTSTAPPHLITMDALVPSTGNKDLSSHVPEIGPCVGSCSGAGTPREQQRVEKKRALARKRARLARVPAHEGSSKNHSASTSTTFDPDATVDICDVELDASTSLVSPENTSSGKPWASDTKPTTVDDHDSVCHSRSHQRESRVEEDRRKGQTGKSSVSKRSRAAAIHNQSERKRRDKINQRMKTLQKLIPNSSKTDKASMLDEVIEYLKQLQAQVQMMNWMMPHMMLPMTMQQQLQMSMMAQMGMGMGMGVMDMNLIGRPNMPGISPVLHPTAFMPPLASWDGSGGDHRLSTSNATTLDPMSTFLACQSQYMDKSLYVSKKTKQASISSPTTMDVYSRMAALYQQFHQPPTSNPKT